MPLNYVPSLPQIRAEIKGDVSLSMYRSELSSPNSVEERLKRRIGSLLATERAFELLKVSQRGRGGGGGETEGGGERDGGERGMGGEEREPFEPCAHKKAAWMRS